MEMVAFSSEDRRSFSCSRKETESVSILSWDWVSGSGSRGFVWVAVEEREGW